MVRKTSTRTATDGEYLVRFPDNLGPIKLPISPDTTSTGGVQGSSYLQLRRSRSATRGIPSNVEEPRGADVAT